MQTVREATFDVATKLGLTTWYGNPGSTEIPLLADLPSHLTYILGLHEHAVVAMATGHALAEERPVMVSVHTTAGLGNAVSALATARVNRAPLVVLVGQQDRRHIALEPFLTGHLESLAGEYPVSVQLPLRAQDVPGAVARARYEAAYYRGPAIVIVPMDDWHQPMDDTVLPAPAEMIQASGVTRHDLQPMVTLLEAAQAPVLVTGAGSDGSASWNGVVALADRLGCPVWQEPFTARAGFPQDHPRFAGFLPSGRAALRQQLSRHDLVLVIGAGVLKQYHYEPGPLFVEGTVVAVITEDPGEAVRSPARLAMVAGLGPACRSLAGLLAQRGTPDRGARVTTPPGRTDLSPCFGVPGENGDGDRVPDASMMRVTPAAVLAALAERLDPATAVVEEAPSSRDCLQSTLRARHPLGYLSAAMGGLGFALGAATGIKLADPQRPVLAVVGDGSAIYGIQALWSAAHYGAGVLFVVLDNGSYSIMNRLAARQGGHPWPNFEEVKVDGLARALGCSAVEVTTVTALVDVLDEVVPTLAHRRDPLLVNVVLDPAAVT